MTIKTVYVASLASRKVGAAMTALHLRSHGFHIVSTWHEHPTDPGLTIPEDARMMALRDLMQVLECDALVVLAQPLGNMFTGGGHCTEVGIAIGIGKPVVVIGDRSNIFYHLPPPAVFVVESAKAAVEVLRHVHDSGEKRADAPSPLSETTHDQGA